MQQIRSWVTIIEVVDVGLSTAQRRIRKLYKYNTKSKSEAELAARLRREDVKTMVRGLGWVHGVTATLATFVLVRLATCCHYILGRFLTLNNATLC